MVSLTISQKKAVQSLKKCKKCLILKSIRSGKTLTILHYLNTNKYKNILWVGPDTGFKKQLEEEKIKFNIDLNTTYICYQSLKKHINIKYDAVVLDEVHKVTKTNVEHINKIKTNKLIACTGTLPNKEDKKQLIFNSLELKLVHEFTILDAVKQNNVAPFNIQKILIPLSTDKTILVKLKNNSEFYTSENDSYKRLSDKIFYETDIRRKMNLSFLRMRLTNSAINKIKYTKAFLEANKNKRYLVFVDSKETANKISKNVYYEGMSDKNIEDFKTGKINHLVLINKGGTGHTYENIDGCILLSVNSSNTNIQQKIFRSVLYRENYTADIRILIAKDTIEEEWIDKSLKI